MSNPIRILHILQRMEAGGTQALLMNLYRNIDRTKVQFDFLVVYKENQFYDKEIEELGGRLYKFSFREDLKLFKFINELKEFFLTHKEYKIVHCHAYTIGYFCLKAAKNAGVPVRIAHSHSNEAVRDYKYPVKLLMQKLFSYYATDYFACSKEAGSYLFKNKKVIILNNAIDAHKFSFNEQTYKTLRNELRLKDKLVIGHVGRFKKEKNHIFLLEVFREIKKIKKIKKESVLLLIGSGPLEEEVREKTKNLGLSDSIIFLGNRKDMHSVYNVMDVFILPSLFEGLGIVVIEAQASGVPVISSDRLPDEVNISKLYSKLSLNESPSTWAKEAIKAIENPYYHNDMQQIIVDSGFDIHDIAKSMEEYYINKQK